MPKAVRQRIKDAYANVDKLGALVLVKPYATRVDGSPLLRPDEVYVTKTGVRYHPEWCHIVANRWDLTKGIHVSHIADIGTRETCPECDTPLTSSRVTEPATADPGLKKSTPILDARHAAKTAREEAAKAKVNGG